MSRPSANRETAARAAEILARMAPADAGAAAAKIVQAIFEYMEREGHTAREAQIFALEFAEAMVEAIRAMARPSGTVLH